MRHPFYPSSFVFTQLQKVALITGVLCFLAGLLIGWAIGARHTPTPTIIDADEATTTALENTDDLEIAQGDGDTLAVDDQKAGKSVYVAGVALSRPGWVAVREEVDGKPGRILGAQWFPAGDHTGAVTLLRSTAEGERYHAYLFFDDGDMRFDSHKDLPVTQDGLLILTPFTTY